MGKPSSTQLSRKSSHNSLNASMSTEKLIPKITKKKRLSRKQRRRRTQQNIQKLFNQLRDASQGPTECNMSDSIIELDDSTQNTIISIHNDDHNIPVNEPGSNQDILENSIIVPDDDVQIVSTPQKKFLMHHSTPIPKQNSALDELILSQSNNNMNLQNNNVNTTKEYNANSYLTIDLTRETNLSISEPTIIDLANTTENDCTLVSADNASMSGDSDVTVLQNQPVSRKLKKFTKGIANLNTSEKGKLLELITQTIFSGCKVPANAQNSLANIQNAVARAPETIEDTYIKEVILGGKPSRNSVGSNVYHPSRRAVRTPLRMVVIDGSNVAMEHGRGQHFSVRGLQICIDYFLRRGHVVKAFVPRFRCRHGMSTDGKLLDYLERKGLVIYTPSRQIKGKTITPYDDRYIIQCAAEFDAVVVSGDNYRDLINENPKWKFVIENRVLPFTWVDDMIMFPKDPLGRYGPTLDQFLRHHENTPY